MVGMATTDAWEVKVVADNEVDLWRNRRIYQYDQDSVDSAMEVARRRGKEGDTLEVTGDGARLRFVHDGRRWRRP